MTDLVSHPVPAVAIERDERTVRLGDIGIARENLRFNEPPDDDIPTLAATLKAAGQLQRLTVRPGRGRKEQLWMALDGRRRRPALGQPCARRLRLAAGRAGRGRADRIAGLIRTAATQPRTTLKPCLN